MQTEEYITRILENPSGVTPEMVDELAKEYPFFTLPALLLLKRDSSHRFLSTELRERYMAMLALNAADPETMMALADHDSDRWIGFYPPRCEINPATEDAIDTFLENYGQSSSRENEVLERLIFNPTPDYAEMLAQEEVEKGSALPLSTGNEQDDRINAFIARTSGTDALTDIPDEVPIDTPPTAVTEPQKEPATPAEKLAHHHAAFNSQSSLSESLAKIYIRQKKYDKAYEVIHNLSINHPEKNRYYDDQLRFLRKLMINAEHAKK